MLNKFCFQQSHWFQALTLTERVASLHASALVTPKSDINILLAKQRVDRWRTQPPFNSSNYFSQRLAAYGISEENFLFLLGESSESLQKRLNSFPTWLLELDQAFFDGNFSDEKSALLSKQLGDYRNKEKFGFLNVVKPLISWSRDCIHQRVQDILQKYSSPPFDPVTIEDLLFKGLPELIHRLLERVLVLELNISRLEGSLIGYTSQERFQNFVYQLNERDTSVTLLSEYPVLARQIVIHINNWINSRLEAILHLCKDWNNIRANFCDEADPGILVEIDGGAGDKHREGRCVLIFKFSSNFKIVYKPRSLALDVHFQELLAWFNKRGCQTPLQTQKILACGSYGWVEFIAARDCSCKEEVQRFYKRQGCYLALLYVLEASDFHFENLIAAGEHPVLVDVESLFQPRINKFSLNSSAAFTVDITQNSVLRAAMLPQRWWSNSKFEGVEISGLGGANGQLLPDRDLHLEAAGTDEMRFVRKQAIMSGALNLPKLNGVGVNSLDYVEEITAGFCSMYQLIQQHKETLLSENSPLIRFAENEVRVILRPSRIYSCLLYESFHPDVLRNAIERDRYFDKLWLDVQDSPNLTKVIYHEQKDLHNGDIPLFTSRPNSCDLWSSNGERIANFFDESGMILVQRRLQHLSEQDLAQNLWVIRASLATLEPLEPRSAELKNSRHKADYSLINSHEIFDSEQLHEQSLIVAQAVAKRLEMLAWHKEGKSNWLGLKLINKKNWQLTPLETSLYEGLPGLVIFFAYLGKILQEERYTSLANSALMTLQSQLENDQPSITSIGGFTGWGGIIYTLLHLATLWDRPELQAQSKNFVKLIPDLIEKDQQFDIIEGAAGCICTLLCLYNCVPDEGILAIAVLCGDHLIHHAKPMEVGIGWMTGDSDKKASIGFSHGVAGISMALLKLSSVTGKERFRTIALQAIEYERSQFISQLGNWLDIRNLANSIHKNKDSREACMTAWCYGAPGVGIARLQSLPYLDEHELHTEIANCLRTTLTHGFGNNHSLCHGDLGNLELVLQASQILKTPEWRYQLNLLATRIIENINRHGWLCGEPLQLETPGLMTGLTGIGYGFLRLAAPALVPSVLVLESPCKIDE